VALFAADSLIIKLCLLLLSPCIVPVQLRRGQLRTCHCHKQRQLAPPCGFVCCRSPDLCLLLLPLCIVPVQL
jgi:hypothetical protein